MNRLKLLLVSSIIAVLPGCALYDAYMMAGYDTNEYALAVKVKTIAEVGVEYCDKTTIAYLNFKDMYEKSVELRNFAKNTPDNPEASKLAQNLVDLSKTGLDLYKKQTEVSPAFCKLKMGQIEKNADKISHVLARKPR